VMNNIMLAKGELVQCTSRGFYNGKIGIVVDLVPYSSRERSDQLGLLTQLHKDEYSCIILFNGESKNVVIRAKWLEHLETGI